MSAVPHFFEITEQDGELRQQMLDAFNRTMKRWAREMNRALEQCSFVPAKEDDDEFGEFWPAHEVRQ